MGTAATILSPKLMDRKNAEIILEQIVDRIVIMNITSEQDDSDTEYGDYRSLIVKSDPVFIQLCKNHAENSSLETQQMIIKHVYKQYLDPVLEVLLKPIMSMGDMVTYNGCKNHEWMLSQLSTINFKNLDTWNSCSIGNITRLLYTFFSYLMKDKLE
ncbi:soluble/myristyl eev [Skunkpox virus]|uniref:Soluble/myristyl eev n=1 Tax=Skunkpox virus TaxID=160796 RepID=A0A1C9KBP2_9POXV|nr:soluble/myristyl eev [Skunkpox virus]AOP31540.1 soluble/myristyl eev [Skunkpox virus]